MNPKISIIVPVYNVEKYLEKCLKSLINQTLKEIEIILINDGSTDNSKYIIEKYLKKDKRIILFDKENGGQASARNFGIKKANGEFILFIDSDDFVSTDICKKLYDKALKENSDIVTCKCKLVDENENEIESNSITFNICDANKNFMLNQSGPCFKLIKSKILKSNNLYFPELRAYEDIGVVPAWALFTKNISCIDEQLYYYLVRQGSTMNQLKYNNKLTHIFDSLENLKKYFDTNENYQEELEWIYIEHLLHFASLRFLNFDSFSNIDKIVNIIKKGFPNWRKNKYYKLQSIKYKIVCNLIYLKKYKLLKLILSRKK